MNYTNTLEDANRNDVSVNTFSTRKEAQKAARKTAKEFNLQRHAGHVINYSTGFELFTNY